MRSPALVAVSLLVLGAAACSAGNAASAPDADLARDLQLASTPTFALVPASPSAPAAFEAAPPASPAPAVRPRPAASGNRRVPSRARAVPPAPVERPAPAVQADVELAAGDEGVSDAVRVAEAAGGVALPRPVPATVGLPTVDTGDEGRGGGWGRGGIFGPGGAVIRGGEIDDCRIHDGRARRPVYRAPARVGVGSSRWPAADRPPAVRTGNSDRERGGNSWPAARGRRN